MLWIYFWTVIIYTISQLVTDQFIWPSQDTLFHEIYLFPNHSFCKILRKHIIFKDNSVDDNLLNVICPQEQIISDFYGEVGSYLQLDRSVLAPESLLMNLPSIKLLNYYLNWYSANYSREVTSCSLFVYYLCDLPCEDYWQHVTQAHSNRMAYFYHSGLPVYRNIQILIITKDLKWILPSFNLDKTINHC
jgi:hypothetical protein